MTKDNTFQFLIGKNFQDFTRKKLKKDDLYVSLISTRVLVPPLRLLLRAWLLARACHAVHLSRWLKIVSHFISYSWTLGRKEGLHMSVF